jgi:hypothetical protein
MYSNHPIDPVEIARAIVRSVRFPQPDGEIDPAAERDTARVVRVVRDCVARYGDAFPLAARVRSLEQRDR